MLGLKKCLTIFSVRVVGLILCSTFFVTQSARADNWANSSVPPKLASSLKGVGLNSAGDWTSCRAQGQAGNSDGHIRQVFKDGWAHFVFIVCIDKFFNLDDEERPLNRKLVVRKAKALSDQMTRILATDKKAVFVVSFKSREYIGGWNAPGEKATFVYERFERSPKIRAAYARMLKIFVKQMEAIPADALAFNLMNEPEYHNLSNSLSAWEQNMTELLKAVRDVAPDRVVILEGTRKSLLGRGRQPDDIVKPLGDSKVIYGFHFYEPYSWTHAKTPNQAYSDFIKSLIQTEMGKISDFSNKYKVPVVLSEVGVWGPEYKAGEIVKGVSFETRAKYAADVYESTVPNGIGVTWWALHDETTPYGGSGRKMQHVLNRDEPLWRALRLDARDSAR